MAKTAEEEFAYRVVCTGVSLEEFNSLRSEVRSQFPRSRVAIRNPFIPDFHSKEAHEFIVTIGTAGLAGLGYAGKKTVDKLFDVLADVVKRKLDERRCRSREVIIYAPNGDQIVLADERRSRR
jgi:hypothetical protein